MHALIMAAALAAAAPAHPAASRLGDWGPVASGDLTGVVRDSAGGQGLAGGDIIVSHDGRIIVRSQIGSPPDGFRIHNLPDGPTTSKCGSWVSDRSTNRVTIGGGQGSRTSTVAARAVRRSPAGAGDHRAGTGGGRYADRQRCSSRTTITARRPRRPRRSSSSRSPEPLAPRARSISADSTPSTPTTSTACRCQPGSPAASTSCSDPDVVNEISFQTGSWDAEYGNKNAAIVDVNTRVPAGGLQGRCLDLRRARSRATVRRSTPARTSASSAGSSPEPGRRPTCAASR